VVTVLRAHCTYVQEAVQASTKKSPIAQLHSRLASLLIELEPYEQKLIQLNKKMKIKLRKEHENYSEDPPDKQKQVPGT